MNASPHHRYLSLINSDFFSKSLSAHPIAPAEIIPSTDKDWWTDVTSSTGLVALVRESLKPIDVPHSVKKFEVFLQENVELKISVISSAEVILGIPHQVLYCLEDLPLQNYSDDEHDDNIYPRLMNNRGELEIGASRIKSLSQFISWLILFI